MQLILPSLALRKKFVGAEAFNITTESDTDTDKETGSYHAFRIGDIGLLIPQDTISEVAEELAYCQLPNTSAVLYGMANLRGNIIPIFDLHAQLNIEIRQNSNRKILVIGEGQNAVAVLINELPVRLIISAQDRCSGSAPLPGELQQFVKNSYQANNKIWFDLDLKGLFSILSEFI